MRGSRYEWMTGRDGREYGVRVINVGQNFAHCGRVVARNGRVVHETRVVPFGFQSAAYDLAVRWVEQRNG